MMDDRPLPLRLVYSDELGQLKVVQTADGAQLGTAAVAATWGQPDKLQCIDCVQLGSSDGITDTSSAVLAVARRSGCIELLSPLTGELLGSIAAPPTASSSSGGSRQQADAARVRGLHLLWGEGEAAGGLPAVLSVTQGGVARLHVPVPAAALPPQQQAGQQQQQAGPQQQQQAGQNDGSESQGRGAASWQERRSWQVPAEVCCTAYDAASGRLAVGCQGAELRLFDVGTGETAFAFKGGKPNMVGLVDRPWNTAIAFLPPSSPSNGPTNGSSNSNSSGKGSSKEAAGATPAPGTRLLVGTGYHKVRLYDSEAGKRPQMDLTWGEGRITCLAVEPDGQRCWVGNGVGHIEVLDLRTRKFGGAIKGLAGAARSLAVHPDVPVVASVGLDRYLRLHDRHSRQLLAKVYLKTLPTGVAFCPTDASMLPARKEPPAEERGRQGRRRRRSDALSSGDEDEEDDGDAGHGSDSEGGSDSEAELKQKKQMQQRNKRSGQRREGGSARRGKGGKQQRRPTAVGSD